MRSLLVAALVLLSLGVSAKNLLPQSPMGHEMAAQVDKAKRIAEKIRGRRITHDVHATRTSQAALGAYVARRLKEELTGDVLRQEEIRYSRLGLLSPCKELFACIVQGLGQQIAGIYDPEARTLYVTDTLSSALEIRTVLVHEWTHALQHERMDLVAKTRRTPGHGDYDAAQKALLEGEATLTMMVAELTSFAGQEEPTPAQLTAAFVQVGLLSSSLRKQIGARLSQQSGLPRALAEELVFVYGDGLAYVYRAYREDGWGAVDKRRPLSSEQIIHPERAKDCPHVLHLPRLGATGGRKLRRLDPETMGELGYQALLRTHIDETSADRAAEGWAGDSYFVLFDESHPKTPREALVLVSQWDSIADAAELADAIGKIPRDAFPSPFTEYRVRGDRFVLWTGDFPPPEGALAQLLRDTKDEAVCRDDYFEARRK